MHEQGYFKGNGSTLILSFASCTIINMSFNYFESQIAIQGMKMIAIIFFVINYSYNLLAIY